MSNETQGQHAAHAGAAAIVRGGDGSAYAVPPEVMERRRVSPERRAQVEAEMREQAGGDAASLPTIPADEPIFAFTREDLAPYRLSDEEREALDTPGGGDEVDVQGFQLIAQFVPWMPLRISPRMGVSVGRWSGAWTGASRGTSSITTWFGAIHTLGCGRPAVPRG